MPKAKINQGGGGKKHITNPRHYFQPFCKICKSGKMKSILTLLAAVVLFGLTFNLSSCKQCDKEGKNPAGGDDNTNNMPNTPSDTKTSNGALSDGDGKTPGGSNTQDLVPTKTLEKLKADIIKLVNAAGTFEANTDEDEDTLFRDIISKAARNIESSIDNNDSNAKKWADKFSYMWGARVQWVYAVHREIADNNPSWDENRDLAEEYRTEAEGLHQDAEPDLKKIRRKDYNGLLEQGKGKPAETPKEFAARKEMLHTALKTVEGEKGNEANRIWKELTKTVDTYRIQKAKEKGK
jgi:hypothetical protein